MLMCKSGFVGQFLSLVNCQSHQINYQFADNKLIMQERPNFPSFSWKLGLQD